MTTNLDDLPVQRGFRLRGTSVTRLETFVDAAFAFGVTMLVISVGTVPNSVAELIAALHRLPTFAACFLLLLMFWSGHERWSRRFGLEDRATSFLSLALVFTTLVWIYPLRMVISGGFAFVTNGWVPTEMQVTSIDELQDCFLIYDAGFFALSAILWALHRVALRRADELGLDATERHETRRVRAVYALQMAFAAISIALTFPARTATTSLVATLPGFVYCLMGFAVWFLEARFDRQRARNAAPR